MDFFASFVFYTPLISFAASDFFEITINGLCGHAAKPQIAVDPTVVGSHIVIALQSIVSRNADPTDQIVVSVTSFETSSKAFNVIPQTVVLRGTVRTLSVATRDLAEKRLVEISAKTGDVSVSYTHLTLPTNREV